METFTWGRPLRNADALAMFALAPLPGLVLFPLGFPIFSFIGAYVVNVAVLAAVLWHQWVPSDIAS